LYKPIFEVVKFCYNKKHFCQTEQVSTNSDGDHTAFLRKNLAAIGRPRKIDGNRPGFLSDTGQTLLPPADVRFSLSFTEEFVTQRWDG
jgi:hypothetical protein